MLYLYTVFGLPRVLRYPAPRLLAHERQHFAKPGKKLSDSLDSQANRSKVREN